MENILFDEVTRGGSRNLKVGCIEFPGSKLLCFRIDIGAVGLLGQSSGNTKRCSIDSKGALNNINLCV